MIKFNALGIGIGLYFFLAYFFIKRKHNLNWILYGKYLERAQSITDKRKLELDLSRNVLIFGLSVLIISTIEANVKNWGITVIMCLSFAYYIFNLFSIRKNIVRGLYD